MSRKYQNKAHKIIEISQEHLDKAVDIYAELQKMSPSGRVSWARHKRMMEEEGFYDSENSENYRQLVKSERKKRGMLLNVEEYKENLSESKLASVKSAIGELREAQLTARTDFNRLNRMKREWTKDILLIESAEKVLEKVEWDKISQADYQPAYSNDGHVTTVLAGVSDLHYGAIVDVEGHKYNTEIAEQLLMDYADRLIDLGYERNTETIYVIGMGDFIEHINMRPSQPYSVEETYSHQIVGVSELIIKFLNKLSHYFKIKYAAISGNHDRIFGKKDDNTYGDSAVVLSNKIVETYIKYAEREIEYIEAEPYHHIVQCNKRTFMFVHGDTVSLKKNSVLAEQSALYHRQFDALLAGHVHYYSVNEVGDNKYVATFGSFKGTDEYSLKTIGASSCRSQGVVIVDEAGDFELKQVKI